MCGDVKLIGIVSGGWLCIVDIVIMICKGSGLVELLMFVINVLIVNGSYWKVFDYWWLDVEVIDWL